MERKDSVMEKKIGDKIGAVLKEKNMTQKQLAQESGLTEAAVSHYVKGDREPRSRNLEIIAGVLGVSVGFLLGAGVESAVSKAGIGQSKEFKSFDEVKALLEERAASFSAEEKMALVRILSQ